SATCCGSDSRRARSPTSSANGTARSPPPSAAAAAARRSGVRATIATRAPASTSRRQTARPMPAEAPVTRATRSASALTGGLAARSGGAEDDGRRRDAGRRAQAVAEARQPLLHPGLGHQHRLEVLREGGHVALTDLGQERLHLRERRDRLAA